MDNQLKLVITADTSDAKKKLEDVGKTKVDPVKVDVTADKVKVDAPKVAPVKVPVVADQVKVDAPKVAPVKVPVVTPKPVTVDVKALPNPLKPKVEQPKPVTIQSRWEGTAIGQATKALHGVRELVGRVMSGLGLFGLAVNGVMAVVEGFRSLHDWMNRAQKQAEELRETLAAQNVADRISREAESYDALNKSLAETVRLEKERADVLNARRLAERTVEDAKAENAKQTEIARLDPAAIDYATQKAEIERRYQLASVDRNRNRNREDNRQEASALYGQARSKDAEANRLEAEYKRAQNTANIARERNWAAGMAARGGDETAKARKEETEKQWKTAEDAAKKIREAMEAARNEAQSLRNRAAEKTGANLASDIRADADAKRIRNEQAAELQRQIAETDRQLKDGRQNRYRQEDAALDRQKQEDISALDPTDKNYAFQKKDIEDTYAIRAAEKKVERADNETDRKIAVDNLESLKLTISTQRRESLAQNVRTTNDRKISDVEAFSSRAASIDSVSQNRLTAMGLGSGVSASGNIQGQLSSVLNVLKEQLSAIKDNKPQASSNVSVYGE